MDESETIEQSIKIKKVIIKEEYPWQFKIGEINAKLRMHKVEFM